MMTGWSDGSSEPGTTAGIAARLRSTLPTGWFPVSAAAPAITVTPVLDGLLAGLAQAWSFCFGLLGTVVAQARLSTASGSFLDMISVDFFGSILPRRNGEPDESFRERIRSNLISRRGTRQDVVQAVARLTSAPPFICEPTRAADCGGYGGAGQPGIGGGLGYGVPGLVYGSASVPFQYLLSISGFSSFAPGILSRRESAATFVDGSGLIRSAMPQVLRPSYQLGVCVGPLLEARGYNLIIDSRFWSGFTQSSGTGDTAASWLVDPDTTGLFGSDPVMTVSGTSGTRKVGPSIDVASGGAVITGSAWILISPESNFASVELALIDLGMTGSTVYAAADMTLIGKWQRLVVSRPMQAAPERNLRMSLLFSGSGDVASTILSQCWQIETGSVATSYIPTSGTLGIRAQDNLVNLDPVAIPAGFTASDILDVVASTIPAATIAWISVALSIPVK